MTTACTNLPVLRAANGSERPTDIWRWGIIHFLSALKGVQATAEDCRSAS